MHLLDCFQTIDSAFLQPFPGATEPGKSKRSCNFGIILSNNLLKNQRKKRMFFRKKRLRLSAFYYLEPSLYLSNTVNVEAMNTLIPQRNNHNESRITVKVTRRTQNLKFTEQLKNQVLHSSKRTYYTFLEVMLALNLE